MLSIYTRLKKEVLNLIFPHSCAGCGAIGFILCDPCRLSLKFIPPACFGCGRLVPGARRIPPGRTCKTCRKTSKIYAFLSPYSYGDPATRELVHYLKYRRVRGAAEILAGLLSEYSVKFKIKLPGEFIVIPMPLHKYRERTRGFNQAFLIAEKFVFSGPGGVVRPELLERKKDTKPQVGLLRSEREINVAGAFVAPKPESLKDKVVLLLDDVKTTGATLEEAARVLKEAGVKRVWAVTIAH